MSADTFTALLGLLKQGTGNNNNSWGSLLNTGDFDEIDLAIAGILSEAVVGGTLDLSGTPPPAGPSGAIHAIISFTGVLASDQTVKVPNLSKIWLVENATSGAFALKFKTPSGSASTAIPQNSGLQMVLCDGANNIIVFPFNTNQIQMPDGTVGAPAYSNLTEPTSGWRRAGTQDWRFVVNGVDVLQITGTGAGTPSVVNVLSPNLLQQSGVQVGLNWVVAGGTADAITATYSPAVLALTDGLICFFRATTANVTTTPTFAANATAAHTITRRGGAGLAPGDIPAVLAEVIVRYNLANTRWELLNPQGIPAGPPPASFKNLSIKVATNTTVALAADFITVTDGTNFQTAAFNQTINLGTTGANALDTGTVAIDSWYAIWAIAKADGTVAGLASTSFTAPTMPSGYTYKARVGAIKTVHGSATLFGTWQFGRKAQYVVGLAQTTRLPLMSSGGTGDVTIPTWTAINVTAAGQSSVAPTTASHIKVALQCNSSPSQVGIVAPNNGYGAFGSTANPAPINVGDGSASANMTIMGELLLESSNIYHAASATGAGVQLIGIGWEDNI